MMRVQSSLARVRPHLPVPATAGAPRPVTLLELVTAISEVTHDDREVVATVIHMLRSGSVRLKGNFREATIDELC